MNFQIPLDLLLPGSSRHQSPDVRHGPEAAATSPRRPRKETRVGRPSRSSTLACGAGRNTRKPAPGAVPFSRLRLPHSPPEGRNRLTRNCPGRCVSANSGEPILPSPTRFASRAMVSSNFSGSGPRGRNNPPRVTRGRVGSAARTSFRIGAAGGPACNCRRSNLKSILESRMGTGRRKTFSNVLGGVVSRRNWT